MVDIKRDTSSEENERFWESVSEASKVVEGWPLWKRADAGVLDRYQFATLRYTHDLSCGEFVIIGLVMLAENALVYRINDNFDRLSNFFSGFDVSSYQRLVEDLDNSLARYAGALRTDVTLHDVKNALLPEGSCFSWSGVMFGVAKQPARRFNDLYQELVLRYER